MTPYFDQNGITLYHGDFLESSNGLPCADCVMADPPYAETSLPWDHWPDGWPEVASRRIKPNGSMWCFGSLRMFLDRQGEFSLWNLSHEIVWEKHNGSGFFTDRFRRVHEFAVHYYPKSAKWGAVYKSPQFTMDATARTVRRKSKPSHWTGARNESDYASTDGGPRMMRSVLQVRSCHGSALNETQKPIGIIRPLLEYACPVGGLVLVPFAGSGSELLAAKESGRSAIGFEIREEQCEIAANRLSQGVMFTEPVG